MLQEMAIVCSELIVYRLVILSKDTTSCVLKLLVYDAQQQIHLPQISLNEQFSKMAADMSTLGVLS